MAEPTEDVRAFLAGFMTVVEDQQKMFVEHCDKQMGMIQNHVNTSDAFVNKALATCFRQEATIRELRIKLAQKEKLIKSLRETHDH